MRDHLAHAVASTSSAHTSSGGAADRREHLDDRGRAPLPPTPLVVATFALPPACPRSRLRSHRRRAASTRRAGARPPTAGASPRAAISFVARCASGAPCTSRAASSRASAMRSSGGTTRQTRPISRGALARPNRSPVRSISIAFDQPTRPGQAHRADDRRDAEPHLGEPELARCRPRSRSRTGRPW